MYMYDIITGTIFYMDEDTEEELTLRCKQLFGEKRTHQLEASTKVTIEAYNDLKRRVEKEFKQEEEL